MSQPSYLSHLSHKIILCRNVKGGCGTTLVSLNLAYELSRSPSNQTILIQLSKFPDLHCYLQFTKETNLATLLNFINENKTEEGLEKSIQESSLIKFLPSPSESSPLIFQPGNFKKLISTISSTYHTIIIDLDQSVPTDLANHLVSICNLQLIFSNFDQASLAKTTQFLQTLNQETLEKTFTITNQTVKTRRSVSHDLASLPSSPSEILFNIMNKTPFQSQKKGRLRTSIIKLSESIADLLKN